jgi:hypothetical protein
MLFINRTDHDRPRKITTLGWALHYREHYGWKLFPAPPGEKKSYKAAAYSDGRKWGATDDPAEISADFTKRSDASIGVPTGRINNIIVFDTDTKQGHPDLEQDGELTLQQIAAELGTPLPDTLMAETPSGGRHRIYKPPADPQYMAELMGELGIDSIGSGPIAPGVDIKADGGMIIVPPSEQRRWINELEIAELPIAWIKRLGRKRQPQTSSPPHQHSSAEVEVLLIGIDPDIDRESWFEILCAIYRELGDVDGFAVADRWSATGTKYRDGKPSNQCATQWQSIRKVGGYNYNLGTIKHYYANQNIEWQQAQLTEFDQDFIDYFAASLPADADVTDKNDNREEDNPDNEKTAQPAQPKVVPVDLWAKFDPPPLPTGLLPEVIENYAFAQAKLMGADPSGLAMTALIVCGAALPDHVKLQPKKYDRDWVEAVRIWGALVGPPSVLKTPILYRAAAPLIQIDGRMWGEYCAAKQHYDDLSKEERRAATRPLQTRLRLEDTTIEGAQEVLKDSPNGLLLFLDELGGWFGSMDKYNGSRGALADRGFWLRAYNGGQYALNRVGRGHALIPNLSVSVIGGIQPEMMRAIAADSIDDGLLQRLLPIILRPAILTRDEPISPDITDLYIGTIEGLHEMQPDLLSFDEGAMAIRQQLEQKHIDLMNCESINKKLAAHIGKYNGIFVRLCLLWHCIENGEGLVKERTAQRVADFLHTFLLPHAIAFYVDVLGLSDDHDRLAAVAGYILARGLTKITNSDIHHGDKTMRGLKKHEMQNVFHQLEALGWITEIPAYRYSGPPQWKVNPEVHRRFADRAVREAERRKLERDMILALVKGGRSDP